MRAAALPLLLCLTVLAAPLRAQEPDCADPSTQSGLNECAYQDFLTQDKKLNEAYAETLQKVQEWDDSLDEEDRGAVQALRQSQRAWISFRDAACAVDVFPVRGGSVEPMMISSCMARMTETRSFELYELFERYNL